MKLVQQSEAVAARRRVYFDLRGLDGVTPATGEAAGQPQVSLNGAAWTNTGIGALVAIGQGRYYADLTQIIVGNLGFIETRYKSSNTIETPGDGVQVVAFDPYNGDNLGLDDLAASAVVLAELDPLMEDGEFTTAALVNAPQGSNDFTSDDRATLNAILSRITSVQVVQVATVDDAGNFYVYKGFDHNSATSQQLQVTVEGLPALGATLPILEFAETEDAIATGTQTSLGGGSYRFDFNLPIATLADLTAGESYTVRVRAFPAAGSERMAAELSMNVR